MADGLRSPKRCYYEFRRKDRTDWEDLLRGRNKEICFYIHELRFTQARRPFLALLREQRQPWRNRPVLQAERNRQTTLSSDPERALIGDDEHGWGDDGIFNFEGGCYAKTIRINPEFEPLVWSAINRFGTLMKTYPSTRTGYQILTAARSLKTPRGLSSGIYSKLRATPAWVGTLNFIFFLTADAFGVLPPLARLDTDQAMYYFLSGYTSKLAGTERGLGEKPEATFSTCFGAPFLPLKPAIYANLLAKKLEKHHTKVWLLNTGWSGGGFGTGKRIALPLTRAMISAVLNGSLDEVPTHAHPIFRVSIPDQVAGVPQNVLNPEQSWTDQQAYTREALGLAGKFAENFKKYQASVPDSVSASGPVQP